MLSRSPTEPGQARYLARLEVRAKAMFFEPPGDSCSRMHNMSRYYLKNYGSLNNERSFVLAFGLLKAPRANHLKQAHLSSEHPPIHPTPEPSPVCLIQPPLPTQPTNFYEKRLSSDGGSGSGGIRGKALLKSASVMSWNNR
jgi:hypothetical protein